MFFFTFFHEKPPLIVYDIPQPFTLSDKSVSQQHLDKLAGLNNGEDRHDGQSREYAETVGQGNGDQPDEAAVKQHGQLYQSAGAEGKITGVAESVNGHANCRQP